MTKKLKAIWLRLRHPRGKRGYLFHYMVPRGVAGVPTYGSARFWNYRMDLKSVQDAEAFLKECFGSPVACISITPLDEYSHND